MGSVCVVLFDVQYCKTIARALFDFQGVGRAD